MHLKVIKTAREYEEAINELERLIHLHPEPETEEADHLELLSVLIERYESEHYTFDVPDPITAIRFVLEQRNLTPEDLVAYMGSHEEVAEVLSGNLSLSMEMVRRLHRELGIPLEILINEPVVT